MAEPAMDVTIIVPTHDRAAILERSLGALRSVDVPTGLDVEALVVANACSDATEAMVRRLGATFPFPLRLVSEPSPGLNTARNRGLHEARGAILAYLDDDAFVEPGWLTGLVHAFDALAADLVAGRVELWWQDVARPAWSSEAVERLLSYLDLGPEARELPSPGQVVGANFAVRRQAALEVGGFLDGLDRVGADLLSGGDTELAVRLRDRGYRLVYAPSMAVRHWVAPARVDRTYLDRVARARGRTRVALLRHRGELRVWPLLRHGLAQAVHGGYREIRHRLHGDRTRAMAARLARQRAVGTVAASLRTLLASR